MKSNIHPTYHNSTKARCACGKSWTVGSTKSELETEICSACHPFFSGKEKIVDTRGRVEKFKKRQEKSQKRIGIGKSKK